MDASIQEAVNDISLAVARAVRDAAVNKAKTSQIQRERWRRFAETFPQAKRAFVQLELLEKHRLEYFK